MIAPKASGHAPVNGINMYYEIYGEGGMPLVLIHGGGSTIGTSFGNLLPWLDKNRMIIAMELQAHGRTTDRDAPESFEQDAKDVVGLLAHLGVHKADFLGFSNGGTTTLHIAAHHPETVNKIVVVSANYQREGMIAGFFEGMRHATLHDMPQVLQDAFLKLTPDKDSLQTMFEKDKARMLNFEDMRDEDLQSIKAQTLLIVGDKDVMTCEHVLKMSHLIPHARLTILPGTHGSFIGEEGTLVQGSRMIEATTILIEEFLRG